MSKKGYLINRINKEECSKILLKHHYLKDISKGFKSGINYGLFNLDVLVGVCIFTGFPVPELAKGCFGLNRDEQDGLYELSRLCILPETQRDEHNITSWFVSRCLKKLKKEHNARAVLSYADCDFHSGIIYKACNFKYYGKTAQKKDFWILKNGKYQKHSRGKVKGLEGEWRPRSQKHRYLIIYDKTLKTKWKNNDP